MNIVYYENTPFYTPETYTQLFHYAEHFGKETLREYFNTFRNEFQSEVQANESLRNLDSKMYISAEILIAMELQKNRRVFFSKYGFIGKFFVSTTANGVDIIYAVEPDPWLPEGKENVVDQPVRHIEAKCTNGVFKKYTRGNVVRPINRDGYYLSTKCSWKYHLTKKHDVDQSFVDILNEFSVMDAVHAVITLEDDIKPIISELWFIGGDKLQGMLARNRNKQNLIQINPSSFYTIFKEDVELIYS